MSAMSKSARGEHVTRNRDEHAVPHDGAGALRRGLGVVLTLALLAPSAALLAARGHGLLEIGTHGVARECGGLDIWGPVLHAGLPTVALLIALPVALLSLADRAGGWIWLAVVLAGAVLLDLVLRSALPGCL